MKYFKSLQVKLKAQKESSGFPWGVVREQVGKNCGTLWIFNLKNEDTETDPVWP